MRRHSCVLGVLAPERLRQENGAFWATLGYIGRPCFKKGNNKKPPLGQTNKKTLNVETVFVDVNYCMLKAVLLLFILFLACCSPFLSHPSLFRTSSFILSFPPSFLPTTLLPPTLLPHPFPSCFLPVLVFSKRRTDGIKVFTPLLEIVKC